MCYFQIIRTEKNIQFLAVYLDMEAIIEPEEASSNKSAHTMSAYAYCIVDKVGTPVLTNLEDKKSIAKDDSLPEHMLTNLFNDVHSQINAMNLCEEPRLTLEDERQFKKHQACEICKSKFSKQNLPCRHHDHFVHEERDAKGVIIKGNYLAALCNSCNLRISEKRRSIPVICHNGGKYDTKFVLEGVDGSSTRVINFLAKTAENFLSVKIQKFNEGKPIPYSLNFIDSFNFMAASLDSLSKNLRDARELTEESMPILEDQLECSLNKIGLQCNASVLKLSKQKGVYPYEFVSSEDILQQETLPPKEIFFSKLRGGNISDEEYGLASRMWEESGCKSLRDYMRVYLLLDTLLLAEVFEQFRKTVIREYSLDPAHFVSAPGFAIQAALYESKQEIDLITDIDLLNRITNNVRGGLVSVVKPYVKLNNVHCPDFDDKKPRSSAVFLDFNSMYAEELSNPLPLKSIVKLSDEEVPRFDLTKERSPEFTYIVVVDTHISEEVARACDDLPLSLHHMSVCESDLSDYTKNLIQQNAFIKHTKGRKLVATHIDQEEYTCSLDFLQVLMRQGLKVTKLHHVYRIEQETCFKSFIDKNIRLRKNAQNNFEKGLYKLLSNSIFGKLLFNPLKRCEEVKMVTKASTFGRLAANPLLKRCYSIGKDKVMMVMGQKNVKMNHPIYVGYTILERAKAKIYSFFYDVLKPHYGERVHLVYTDTDSLLLEFEGVENIEEELVKEPMKSFMDFSNFPCDHPLFDESRKGRLGLLKSETGSRSIVEIICLQPKAYSALMADDEQKLAAKGVNKHLQKNLLHETYRAIHEQRVKSHVETIYNIASKNCRLFTTRMSKNCLSKLETKRFYIDSDKTLGYGHPDIISSETVTKVRGKRPRNYDGPEQEKDFDFNFKRRQPGEKAFREQQT